jgi:tetratricopeptide (TPR) repeat protein
MSAKMYKEALDAKEKNLDANDPELALQLVDLARVNAALKQYGQSEDFFKKALTLLRTSPRTAQNDLQTALQSYGQMLNVAHQPAEAEKIYEEARRLATK